MADIVERLKVVDDWGWAALSSLHSDAAAEIERLREENGRLRKILKDPAAVRINYLRGEIACQNLIDEAASIERERCANIADEYAAGYEIGLKYYGTADKDGGRGRQEGHIKAAREISLAIRALKAKEGGE